jgi:hypothetical protein
VDYPKLRTINIFPIQNSGQTMVCLQDPQNISEKALFLSLPLYFIVSLFDGRHSIRDIQAEYMRKFGELASTSRQGPLSRAPTVGRPGQSTTKLGRFSFSVPSP